MAGAILILSVLAIYRQTVWFDFILFDDQLYVTGNPLVNHGLSWTSFCGIWTNFTAANWHPLTIFSHQLDVTVFGLKAGGHHLTSVLLHAVNTILLFMVIKSFTGTMWRSFFVALLFAIHPLHVESVVWISERKDMLSTMFGLLSLLAYRRYASAPGLGRMLPVALFFALSLMSKPMLVTLPFLMLLLDWWPLCRFTVNGKSLISGDYALKKWIVALCRLTFEKWPLFLLVTGSCVITVVAQHGAISGMAQWPLKIRISNSVAALFEYLSKMVWPVNLGIFYPLPPFGQPVARVLLSAGVIMTLSILALALMRRRPWWFTGWFWYLGTLVPVLGIVQVGSQSWADRYTYWPLTGIFIILAWEGAALWKRLNSPVLRILAGISVFAIMGTLGFTAWKQTSYWRNTESLFKHTLKVVPNNWLAHRILGMSLQCESRFDEALEQYLNAYLVGPRNEMACNSIGKIYAFRGETELSLEWYLRGISTDPNSPTGYYCAANALSTLGRTVEAETYYLKAISLNPVFSDALFNYANTLRDKGRHGESEIRYRDLIKSSPNHIEARLNLAAMLASDNNHAAAIVEYSQALVLKPDNTMVLSNTGKSLLFLNRPEEAVDLFARVVHIQPDDADARFSFALALAGSGRRDDAIQELHSALKINPIHPSALKLKDDLTSAR